MYVVERVWSESEWKKGANFLVSAPHVNVSRNKTESTV
jgi:hypothetical protein